MTDVQFTSFDAVVLQGTVTLPPLPKAALLMVHGIPSDRDEWGFYTDMSEYFAGVDIASLRFDIRGCGGSAPFPLEALTLSAMIADIDAAYWALREIIGGDIPIHIVGTSCGGGVSLRWHNLFNRRIASIQLMAPVLDYEFEVTGSTWTVRPDGPSGLNLELAAKLESTGKVNDDIGYGRAMLNEAHLFNGAAELAAAQCPVTIYQGAQDSVVPLSLTRAMIADETKTELVVVEGADHGFAVDGDDDLTDPATKANHRFVYREMFERI